MACSSSRRWRSSVLLSASAVTRVPATDSGRVPASKEDR
jgi:hypothetical protein